MVECVGDDPFKITISDRVAFNFQSTAIRARFPADHRARIAVVLAKNDTSRVRVVGHTDAVGSNSYNRELSLARADAVRDALAVYGWIRRGARPRVAPRPNPE